MRMKSPLSDIMGSRIKVDIVRYYVNHKPRLSGRECAKIVGYSPPATIKALNELSASGVLWKEKLGKAFLFTFNEEHVLAETLTVLFTVEQQIIDQVVEKFAEELKGKLDSVIVFGSVARGEETANSDIDMIISFKNGVNPKEYRSELIEATNLSYAITGGSVDSFPIEQSELEKKMEGEGNTGMWKDIFGEKPAILFRPKGNTLERSDFPQGSKLKYNLSRHRERARSNV